MERSTELLYWHKYRDCIHYDKKTDTYYYDPDISERAKKSFEAWLAQDKRGRKQLKKCTMLTDKTPTAL